MSVSLLDLVIFLAPSLTQGLNQRLSYWDMLMMINQSLGDLYKTAITGDYRTHFLEWTCYQEQLRFQGGTMCCCYFRVGITTNQLIIIILSISGWRIFDRSSNSLRNVWLPILLRLFLPHWLMRRGSSEWLCYLIIANISSATRNVFWWSPNKIE